MPKRNVPSNDNAVLINAIDKKIATTAAYAWLEENRNAIERTRTQQHWIEQGAKAGITWARKRYQAGRRHLGDIRQIQSIAVEAYLVLPARDESAFRAFLTGAFTIISLHRRGV